MTDWAYFIGGDFDLTKRPKPHDSDHRYLRLAMSPMLSIDQSADPEVLARPVLVETRTYRLMSKVPLENGDMAWIYVLMRQPQ